MSPTIPNAGAGYSVEIVRHDDRWYLVVDVPSMPSQAHGPYADRASADQARWRYLDGKDPGPAAPVPDRQRR